MISFLSISPLHLQADRHLLRCLDDGHDFDRGCRPGPRNRRRLQQIRTQCTRSRTRHYLCHIGTTYYRFNSGRLDRALLSREYEWNHRLIDADLDLVRSRFQDTAWNIYLILGVMSDGSRMLTDVVYQQTWKDLAWYFRQNGRISLNMRLEKYRRFLFELVNVVRRFACRPSEFQTRYHLAHVQSQKDASDPAHGRPSRRDRRTHSCAGSSDASVERAVFRRKWYDVIRRRQLAQLTI